MSEVRRKTKSRQKGTTSPSAGAPPAPSVSSRALRSASFLAFSLSFFFWPLLNFCSRRLVQWLRAVYGICQWRNVKRMCTMVLKYSGLTSRVRKKGAHNDLFTTSVGSKSLFENFIIVHRFDTTDSLAATGKLASLPFSSLLMVLCVRVVGGRVRWGAQDASADISCQPKSRHRCCRHCRQCSIPQWTNPRWHKPKSSSCSLTVVCYPRVSTFSLRETQGGGFNTAIGCDGDLGSADLRSCPTV